MDNLLIGDFEGPLDLLLHLIKKSKMEIFDIEISEITNQYIKYINEMSELNLDIASEYLVMASELIEMKSRKLLPKMYENEEEEEEENPEEVLSIPELAEKYPEADIILELEPGADAGITHETIREYDILCRKNFIVCLNDISPETRGFYEENEIRYFWGYSVTTPYELDSLARFTKVCYVRIGAPLFFEMDLVAKYGIPVRHAPNIAHFNYMP